MAGSIKMSVQSRFNDGLVMDFSPLVTPNTMMTNALNATLFTSNGNEGSLQQDMGNGRVETAYLPEGYIPVGSCEFGDIIYVVSYNPLENKSQIGCFPSPERNITSDEITDLKQNITSGDFQEFTNKTSSDGNSENIIPSGRLIAMSVKKIVYGNQNMQPGDKYIIYEEDTDASGILEKNAKNLSDYANTSHTHNSWPKLVKLRVVSIEDSGKIVDLDSSVKWYDNDYYIAFLKDVVNTNNPDLDSYRSLVSSAYSIFQSKVSGKLAILADLETIDGFSCTYDIFTEITDRVEMQVDDSGNEVEVKIGEDTKYKVYFYTAWETSHNDVNPVGFIFTESKWTNDRDGGKIIKPTYNEETNQIEYKEEENTKAVPILIERDIEGNVIYNYDDIKKYTRTYKLEEPSENYETYITTDSYDAKINDIIDWDKVGDNTYEAINSADYDNVRKVTKVSREINAETGEPEAYTERIDDTDEEIIYYKYLYNLDFIDNGVYQTKGIDGNKVNLNLIRLNDDIINNYFHKDTPYLVTDPIFSKNTNITDKEGNTYTYDDDLSNLVWHYEVAPAMPYGVLDYMSVVGNIDFSKVGSGLIELTTWRYYNSGTISTLTWGLDVYPEPNKGVSEVVMDFYDNQGPAASMHIIGKSSYSGTFTESIILNDQFSSYKINNVDAYGNTYEHAGAEDSEGNLYLTSTNGVTTNPEESIDPTKTYVDDAGTIYANLLYLVRITVKYCSKNILGEYNTENTNDYKTFWRWYWTNGMFNDNYYSVSDFINIQPRLALDFSATFNTNAYSDDKVNISAMTTNNFEYYTDELLKTEEISKTLGAYVYSINQDCKADDTGNMRFTIDPCFGENYDTFYLNADELGNINAIVDLCKSSITKSVDEYTFQRTGNLEITTYDNRIEPIVASDLTSYDVDGMDRSGYIRYSYGENYSGVSLNFIKSHWGDNMTRETYEPICEGNTQQEINNDEIYEDDAYKYYLDSFSLNVVPKDVDVVTKCNESITYTDENGNDVTVDRYQEITTDLDYIRNHGLSFVLTGISFSKICSTEAQEDSNCKVLKSVIHNTDTEATKYSLRAAGLHLYGSNLYFNKAVIFDRGRTSDHAYFQVFSCYFDEDKLDQANNSWPDIYKAGGNGNGNGVGNRDDCSNTDEHTTHLSILDTNPQACLNDALGDTSIAAMVIGRNETKSLNGKKNYGGAHVKNIHCESISFDKLISDFNVSVEPKSGSYYYLTEKREAPNEQIPFAYPSEWGNESVVYNMLLVRDVSNNNVVPISDYFVSQYNSQAAYGYGGQGESWMYATLANMIGSMLAQIYVVVDDDNDEKYAVFSNNVYLNNFTEYWNKDIVVNLALKDHEDQMAIWQLVGIQQLTMHDYCRYLLINAGLIDASEDITAAENIDLNNIYIDVYDAKRTVKFQFGVPYTLDNLVSEYNMRGESSNIIYVTVPTSVSSNGPEIKSFEGNVTSNTLYVWTGSTVSTLNSQSLCFGTNFSESSNHELYFNTYSTEQLPANGMVVNNLSKILYIEDGVLKWRNLDTGTKHTTYDLLLATDADGSKTVEIDDIPNYSIFDIYYPGKK